MTEPLFRLGTNVSRPSARSMLLFVATAFALSGPLAAEEPCLETVGGFPYGPVFAIAQHGNRIVYGSGRALVIAEISPPSAFTPVGEIALESLVQGIALDGDLAYVAHPSGLVVVDLSTPANPNVIGRVATPMREMVDLEIYGSHVYAASRWDPIRIIDVGDPASPVEVGSSGAIGTASSIDVDGGRLYTLASGVLIVFGLADPANPDELGRATLPDGGSEIGVVGPRALVVSGDSLCFIDVSQPGWIQQIGSPVSLGGMLYDIEVAGSVAVIPAGTTNGWEMLLVDLYGHVLSRIEVLSHFLSFSIDANLLGFADRFTGLHLADISIPTAPVVLATIDAPGDGYQIAAVGSHAFVTSVPTESPYHKKGWEAYVTDLRGYSVTEPGMPVQTDRLDFGEFFVPSEIIIEHGLAYFAGDLRIVSVANPEQIELLGELAGFLPGIAKRGPLIYGTTWDPVVVVVDVSDPSNPVLAGNWIPQLPPDQWSIDIDIANGHGYVVSARNDYTTGRFSVLDLTDPLDPVVVGSIELPQAPEQVVVKGVHAFVRSYESPDLHVIDVADPASPQLVATEPWAWINGDLAVSGNVLYSAKSLSRSQGKVFVIDIAAPNGPSLLCELNLDMSVDALAVSRGELYIANGNTGFSIFRQYGGAILLDGFETGTTENWISE